MPRVSVLLTDLVDIHLALPAADWRYVRVPPLPLILQHPLNSRDAPLYFGDREGRDAATTVFVTLADQFPLIANPTYSCHPNHKCETNGSSRTMREPLESGMSQPRYSGLHSVSEGAATHLPILLADPRETHVWMVASMFNPIF
jgi:hypothetical protein